MRKLIFQTDDDSLYDGAVAGPTVEKQWLNARVYQTAPSSFDLMMEYWDSKNGISKEVLFSSFSRKDAAISAARASLKEASSNLN